MPGTGKKEQATRKTVIRLFQKAELSFKKGDWHASKEHASAVIAQDGQHLPAMELYTKSCWKLNQLDGLPQLLRRMTYLNPYEPNYHALMAVVMQSQAKFQEAGEALTRSEGEAGTEELRFSLKMWEAQSVIEWLSHDAVFACAYAKNPEAACLAKGILIESESIEENSWLQRTAVRSSLRPELLARPS